MSEPLLSVKNMKKTFQANGGMFSKKKFVHAVNDVSFDIYPGETFSLVGESGCGKSTTGKLIDHLITPDSGEIWFEGKEISRLSEKEMRSLERIVSAYLDLAEDRAERHIPMTMEDWAKRLDLFLMADDREVLQDAGKITAEIAKAKAETEFEKYRVIQDRLFMSDFDKYMLELEENAKK